MPTVLKSGPYRLYFYSSDGIEPPHVHVERDDSVAKFWIDPIRLASSRGFSRSELSEIERLVTMHRTQLLEAWRDFFGG